MANETTDRCDKCRHFFKPKEGNPGCRRFPPQTHFIVVLRPKSPLTPHMLEPREEQRSSFPHVVADWACGEFAPAITLSS